MTCKRAITAAAFLSLLFTGQAFAGEAASEARVARAATHDTSAPLRETRWDLPPLMQQIIGKEDYSREQIERLRHKLVKKGRLETPGSHTALPAHRKSAAMNPLVRVRDLRVQHGVSAAQGQNGTTPVIGFDGLGYSTGQETGFFPAFAPPDANAGVGLDYVVETANTSFAVYSKDDGSLVMGPTELGSLWINFAGHCGELFTQLVHPIVIYDQLAQRWIISALATYPMAWCIAVSRTSDPAGEYYRYEFDNIPSSGYITDGIKMGMWSDAYYFAFNVFDGGTGQFQNVIFGALNRAAMLKGEDAVMVIVGKANAVYSVLPADLDGFIPPPAQAPGLFMNYISPNLYGSDAPYALALWKMHVDWSNPQATTLTGPDVIEVPPFNDFLCGGAPACVPQPAPGNLLDAVSRRLMYRLAYRNFGDHEALVVNQTVTANENGDPPAAIRWYELGTSVPGADDWSLKQSGTFDPADGASRWVGSIAMDRAGNMALGYSLSGPNTSPSVAYTGRAAGDPVGEMTLPETILAAGSGAQTGSLALWGGYSSMALDPRDDCTFWYTQEYYSGIAARGTWSTHIGAFKFDACTPAPKGVLTGTVTDAGSGSPVRDAHVRLDPGGALVWTDENGNYRIELPTGDFTATAGGFGYADKGVSVTITDGDTVKQDFALAAAPSATLSGKVTDGSGHGYGLYAKISVTTPDFGQVAEVWTDPADGNYSVELPKGFEYALTAKAVLDGYKPATATLSLSTDVTKNFVLAVGAACTAPGYAFQLGGFGEDFNSTWPPQGWTVTNDVTDSPVVWNTNTYWQDRNITGGTGTAADANSGKAWVFFGYNDHYDTSLVTPPLAVTSLPANPVVVYKANYNHSFQDAFDLDISVDGAAWQNVLHWTQTHGTPYRGPGEKVKTGIAAFIPAGASSIRLRWRYYDLAGGNDISVQIDDVAIGACQPLPGGLIAGRVTDANTGLGVVEGVVTDDEQDRAPLLAPAPQSRGLAAGSYVLFAPAGSRTLTVTAGEYTPGQAQVDVAANMVTIKDFALGAGLFTADPQSLNVHVLVNEQKRETLTVHNSGTAAAHYTLLAINTPVPATHPQPTGPFAFVPENSGSAPPAPLPWRAAFLASADCSRAESNCVQAQTPKGLLPRGEMTNPGKPGDVVSYFSASISFNGLAVDHNAGDLWLGSSVGNGGDGKVHRFLFDGTNTGDAIGIASLNSVYSSDMAFDGITGRIWQLAAEPPYGQFSFIYEIDPRTQVLTGRHIMVPSSLHVNGLAFDPVTNTWYAGGSGIIYHFDSSGTLLDSFDFNKPIYGLTYNPNTEHLFVLAPVYPLQNSLHNFYILDTRNHYALLGHFDLPGVLYGGGGPGAGFGHDCNGHLWVSRMRQPKHSVWELESGETGWCSFKGISWLTLAPKLGTVAQDAAAAVELTFDGTGQKPFTSTDVYLKLVGNTPYPAPTIPITVHWDPQPVDLVLTGDSSPTSVRKGDNLIYVLTIVNAKESGHGTASETELTYAIPAGASYVSAGGEGVSCAAPSQGSSSAPAVMTGASSVISCGLGTLAQGASKTVTIAMQVNEPGKLKSHFEITAREPDSDPSSNSLTLETAVLGTADVNVTAADTSLSKGGKGTVLLTIGNSGPDAATGVEVIVSAGAVAPLAGASSSQGGCQSSSGDFVCALGNVEPGATVTVTLTVSGAQAGTGSVTGQVQTGSDDPEPANNVATAAVTVQSGGGSEGGGSSSGGGGALGWLALAALLGLALVGARTRWRG